MSAKHNFNPQPDNGKTSTVWFTHAEITQILKFHTVRQQAELDRLMFSVTVALAALERYLAEVALDFESPFTGADIGLAIDHLSEYLVSLVRSGGEPG